MGSGKVVPKIPILDLSDEKLSDSWNSACQELRETLEKYGCFELNYKKYSIENHNSILEALEEFYNLPDEIKAKGIRPNYLRDYGYNGKSAALPISETVGVMNAIDKQECQILTRLIWPQGNQHFCDAFHSSAMLLAELQELLVKMLGESYGVEKEYMESHLNSTNYLMVCHKYERSNQADQNLGLMGHTDKTFLSVVHQNHVKGLEIRLKDGEGDHWVFYEPSSYNSFIVFAGDVMMGWSNDRIKSCYHRVMVESVETRYTVIMFSRMKGLTEVPKVMVDEEHPLKYKPFENDKLINYSLSNNDADKFGINNLETFSGI